MILLSSGQKLIKRCFDIVCSAMLLLVFVLPILVLLLCATVDTRKFGLFCQKRIGRNGKQFVIYKIRTLKSADGSPSSFGRFLRTSKIDELTQLFNVLEGTMSMVGPRPDLPGYADVLKEDEQVILQVKPGITSMAAIKYYNEEDMLKKQPQMLAFNDGVIWPDKVRMNLYYVNNWSFLLDIKIIIKTIVRILQLNNGQ